MASESIFTDENSQAYHQGCPFLGAYDDLSTKFLFATPEGCCHRARPVEAVMLTYQQTSCLTPKFSKCPVYRRQTSGPLPKELCQPLEPESDPRLWLRLTAVIFLLLLAGLLLAAYGGRLNGVNQQLGGVFGAPTAVAIIPPIATATTTTIPSATASQTTLSTLLPSATFSPTQTSTPEPATSTPTPTRTPIPATATGVPPTATVTSTVTPISPLQAVISVSRVNLRSGPGIAYPVIQVVVEGDSFEVTGRLNDGSWWQICCTEDGQTAWVFSQVVIIEGDVGIVPLVEDLPLPPSSSP